VLGRYRRDVSPLAIATVSADADVEAPLVFAAATDQGKGGDVCNGENVVALLELAGLNSPPTLPLQDSDQRRVADIAE
jgi:hypothetical protein